VENCELKTSFFFTSIVHFKTFFMSKPNSEYYGEQGKTDKEAGREPSPPHGTLSSTVGSLIDGDYEKRDGENNAYWDGYKDAEVQDDDDDD
jgi:hypothetical protein